MSKRVKINVVEVGPSNPDTAPLYNLPFMYNGKIRKSLFHAITPSVDDDASIEKAIQETAQIMKQDPTMSNLVASMAFGGYATQNRHEVRKTMKKLGVSEFFIEGVPHYPQNHVFMMEDLSRYFNV
jgi:hypothetical protein